MGLIDGVGSGVIVRVRLIARGTPLDDLSAARLFRQKKARRRRAESHPFSSGRAPHQRRLLNPLHRNFHANLSHYDDDHHVYQPPSPPQSPPTITSTTQPRRGEKASREHRTSGLSIPETAEGTEAQRSLIWLSPTSIGLLFKKKEEQRSERFPSASIGPHVLPRSTPYVRFDLSLFLLSSRPKKVYYIR